ncbi:MAG: hypothetical protein UHD09_01240 [Bifidobacterium sp.]|nr:hypothetical protein [Bifidobacterium sp.]
MSEGNPYADAVPRAVPALTPARAALEEALVAWMAETGERPAELTVSGLCQRAFVARSTFYANYAGLDDVLATVELRLLDALARAGRPMESLDGGGRVVLDSYDDFVRVLGANEDRFRLLLVDVPSARFVERWKELLGYHFWQRLFVGDAMRAHDRPSTVNRALVLEMIGAAFIAGVRLWLRDPQQVGTPELKALILRLIHDIDEVW